jgi:hypothetical protein
MYIIKQGGVLGEVLQNQIGKALSETPAQSLDEWNKPTIELLRDAQMFIESFYIDWARLNHSSPDHDPNYKPEFPEIVQRIESRLKALKGGGE